MDGSPTLASTDGSCVADGESSFPLTSTSPFTSPDPQGETQITREQLTSAFYIKSPRLQTPVATYATWPSPSGYRPKTSRRKASVFSQESLPANAFPSAFPPNS